MKRHALLALLVLALGTSAFGRGRILINNLDGANEGLNDPTPAAPVGGNPGTTIGQQRLNVMKFAAGIWESILDIKTDVVIDAQFNNLQCDANSAVLGQTGTTSMKRNFPNAPLKDVWYPVSLANNLAGEDLAPGQGDMSISYNSKLGQSGCLEGGGFYYGFDGKHGAQIDLIATVMHEIAHGLGFASNFDSNTGNFNFRGVNVGPSAYDTHIFDRQANMFWTQMSNTQRLTSSTNDQNVVFDGPSTNAAAAKALGPTPFLRVDAPSNIAKRYTINIAGFSGPITTTAVAASFAAPVDVAETEPNSSGQTGTTTDGCSPYSNAAAIAGKIALVDRGYCAFALKAQLAQAAGALAIVIVDNRAASSPPGMSGSPETAITIPVVSLTQTDGNALRAQLANGLSGTIAGDPLQLAGADTTGHVKLYMPSTFAGGSSVSHWDISASPNLLMEPNISDDLIHNVDLTINELMDIGWTVLPDQGRKTLRRK